MNLGPNRNQRDERDRQQRETDAQLQASAMSNNAPGFEWVLPASMHEPVMGVPCCQTCGSQVPIRMQIKHIEWHQGDAR